MVAPGADISQEELTECGLNFLRDYQRVQDNRANIPLMSEIPEKVR